LRFLSQLLETAGLSIVISRRTLLHLPTTSGGTYTFKQTGRTPYPHHYSYIHEIMDRYLL
jgi:hypothetical protein